MNKLEAANKAHDLREEIHHLARHVKINFVALVRSLKEVRDNA